MEPWEIRQFEEFEELAKEQNRRESKKEIKKATIIKLNEWVNGSGMSNIAKEEIKTIFSQDRGLNRGTGWQVINVTGDGFCGVYAVDIGKKIMTRGVREILPTSEILIHPPKEELLECIYSGMEIYLQTRNEIIHDLVKYSVNNVRAEEVKQIQSISNDLSQAEIDQIVRTKNRLYETTVNPNITHTLIYLLEAMIREFSAWVGNDYFNLNLDRDFNINGTLKDEKRAELVRLTRESNVDTGIIFFLSYYFEHNFVVLYYKSNSPDEESKRLIASVTYIRYAIEEYVHPVTNQRNLKNDKIIYNSRSVDAALSNTSLMFNNGHFVLFHNPDRMLKESFIREFVLGKGLGLWGTWHSIGATAELLFMPDQQATEFELAEFGAAKNKSRRKLKRGNMRRQRQAKRQSKRQAKRQAKRQSKRQINRKKLTQRVIKRRGLFSKPRITPITVL